MKLAILLSLASMNVFAQAIYDANGNLVEMTVYGSGDSQYSAYPPDVFVNIDRGDSTQTFLAPGYSSNVIPSAETLTVTNTPIEIVSQFQAPWSPVPDYTVSAPKFAPIVVPPSIAAPTPGPMTAQPVTQSPAPSPVAQPLPYTPAASGGAAAPATPAAGASSGPIYYADTASTPTTGAAAAAAAGTETKSSALPIGLVILFALLAQ